jgi:branched-chain amino acid transport system substrate-binding protein
MKKSSFHILAVLTIVLVSLMPLAACTPTEAPTATPETAPMSTPTTGPTEEETIKIGFFSPTTGFAAADGTSALNSAQLAVKLINESGGVLGVPLELIYYDDAANPTEAASMARKLIEQDKVVAGISGSYSGATRAAAPIFQETGIPMISAYAIHPEITTTGDKIFRVGTLATVQGRVGAELIGNILGAKKVAILTVDNDFGVSLTEGFKAHAIKLGLEIVFEEKYPLGETEFRPIIGRIIAANPDAVYATGYYNEAANLVSQAVDEGLEAQIIGQEGYDSPKFVELAGAAAEGVIITTDLNRDSDRPMTKLFLEQYEAEYGEEADMVGASAFDAVQVLAYAIETAGSTDPGAITTAIAGIKNFEDVASGPFWYYTEGREVVRPVSSQIVRDGAFHLYHEFDDPMLVSAATLAPTVEGPIKIGFFSPTTGFAAADGTSALQSAQLAVKFINEAGGVLGQPIELVYYDDAANPTEAASMARKLIEQDKVVAGISGSYSGATRAAAPIFQGANGGVGVPMISAYAIHPEITTTGDKIFRVGTLATVQGRVGAELIGNILGAKKVAILTVDNDFGVSLTEGFKEYAVKLGLEIVFEEKYPLGETEFRPIIGRIIAANPDAVYATGYYNEAANLVSQAVDEGLEVQIVGQEGYDSPKFIELAGAAAEGVIITTDLNRDSERLWTRLYLEQYEAEYGEEADMVGASAFDAVNVLAYAIEAAGGTDPDAIAAAIAGIKNFENVASGPFLYYTEGREVVRPVSSQIVRDGEFHFYHEFDDLELVEAK